MGSKEQAAEQLVKRLKELGCVSPTAARYELVRAMQRWASGTAVDRATAIDGAICGLSTMGDFAWTVSAAYWRLRREEKSLPSGLVFTPPALAEQIVARLRPGLPVIDLGAGTGMLSIAAAVRGYRVTAIEQDPELASILWALARMLGLGDRIEVIVGDAFSYCGRRDSQIMANPPYTRHHLISAETKRQLSELARRLGTPLSLTAGHYAYFMVHAWHAAWSSREVLLVPTNWLETRYGEPLRELLLKMVGFEIAIADHRSEASAFDHAFTTSCIVTTDEGLSDGTGPTRASFRSLKVDASARDGSMAATLELVRGCRRRMNMGKGRSGEGLFALGNLFHVRRGVATGANRFFVLSQEDAGALGIPADELVGVIRTLSPGPGRVREGLLWAPSKEPSPASLSRIREGERLQIDKRYLCETRHPWWRIKIPDAPRYLLSYMGKGAPKVEENTGKLINLNNVHGMCLAEGMSAAAAQRVVEWLTSKAGQAALLRQARHYQGGLWKLEPGEVEEVRVPGAVVAGPVNGRRMARKDKAAVAQASVKTQSCDPMIDD